MLSAPMMHNPSTIEAWTAVVRAAYPKMTEAQRLDLADRLMRRHPGQPDVQVHDGAIYVSDPCATVADGWERLSA